MSAEGTTQAGLDDVAGHNVPAPLALKTDQAVRDRALTGVAIEWRPFGPKLGVQLAS